MYLHKLTNPDFFPFFSHWENYWEQNGEKMRTCKKFRETAHRVVIRSC